MLLSFRQKVLNSPPLEGWAGCSDSVPKNGVWRGKVVTSQLTSLADTTLTNSSMLTAPVLSHVDIMWPQKWCKNEGTSPPWYSFPKLKSIQSRENIRKPKVRDIVQNPGPVLFKNIMGRGEERRGEMGGRVQRYKFPVMWISHEYVAYRTVPVLHYIVDNAVLHIWK